MNKIPWKLWKVSEQEFSSANSSVNKNKIPALFSIITDKIGWGKDTRLFDIGSGKYTNHIRKYFAKRNVKYFPYDPFNLPWAVNEETLKEVYESGKADAVSLSNVLCTIKEKKLRSKVLEQALEILNPGGIVYLNVYEKNKDGKGRATKKDCWQNNMRLKDYVSEVEKHFRNITIKHSMIIGYKQ